MAELPAHDVLHFCFDNDNGCSLTVLVEDKRFHVTVNPNQFQDRSKEGKRVQRQYRRLLQRAKAAEHSGEDDGESASSEDDDETEDDDSVGDEEQLERERDSAIDIFTPEVDEKSDEGDIDAGPTKALHDWILTPLSQHLPSRSSKSKTTLQDWYYNPIQFYKLSTASGKLQAKEDLSPAWSLRDRLNEILLPTVCIPKKTLKLSVPQVTASELTVLSCAADPAPFHPILVSHKGEEYFLKPVDSTQPGPTIREIHLLHSIAEKGLHSRDDFRCPELRGLVHFRSAALSSKSSSEKKHIAALLLTPIPNPTPLTRLLDSSVSEDKRTEWAEDAERMVKVLHENDIVWGDAKGDNFLVDGEEEKVWIIDFGGSYTEGWVDEEVKETEEGDWMGTEKVINALEDPVKNIAGVDDEQVGEEEKVDEEEEDASEEQEAEEEEQANEEVNEATEVEVNTEDSKNYGKANKKLPPSHKEESSKTTSPSKSSARKRSHATSTETGEDQAPPSKQQKYSKDTPRGETQETKYCICNGVSSGRMLACDGKECKREWFHFECLGMEEDPKGRKWFCEECS